MIQRIPITDRDQWLALRKQDVTASIVAALFGVHPYQSAYGLFAEKTGLELPEIDNAILRRGRLLEGAVAVAVEEDRPSWKLEKSQHYYRDPDIRIGCTPDFYAICPERGRGIIQAKTVAPSAFKKSWSEEGSPPFWISLQTSVEMMLTGAEWGAVAALVVDPFRMDCQIYEVPRHPGVEQRIRDAVVKFWGDVDFGIEPSPDYAKDAELIAAMYPAAVPLKTIDLTGDNHLPVLLAERADIKARAKADEARVKEIDSEIKHKMADAEIATIDGFAITNKVTHRKGYEVQPTSYRALRITDHREKEAINGPF